MLPKKQPQLRLRIDGVFKYGHAGTKPDTAVASHSLGGPRAGLEIGSEARYLAATFN